MKKLVLLVSMALVSFGINAQSTSGDFTLAPQIGLNLSNYTSDVSYDLRVAFTGGVVAEYYISDTWSIRSGLVYDALGAEDDFDNLDKLNYLHVPLNANWHFGGDRNWYLNFGPAFGFLLSAKSDLNDGSEVDVKDALKSTDIGISIGIGYKFYVSENLSVFIDLQNYNGFTDIIDTNDFPFELRNARSAVNVGVIFTP